MENGKMMSGEECSIAILNLDCAQIHTYLMRRKLQSPQDLLSLSSALNFSTPSRLGINFVVNVPEFLTLSQTYYFDPTMQPQLRSALTSLNLSMTLFYGQSVFLRGFHDFLASVGRVRLRESQRHRALIAENRAVSTAMFNLVVEEAVEKMPKDAMVGVQRRVARVVGEIGREIVRRLMKPERPGNVMEKEIREEEVEVVTFVMAQINVLTDIAPFTPEIATSFQADLIVPLLKILPHLRSQPSVRQLQTIPHV
jgi:hypothetical protein